MYRPVPVGIPAIFAHPQSHRDAHRCQGDTGNHVRGDVRPVYGQQSAQSLAAPSLQAQLAGHTIGETFGRAAQFLKLAAANAPAITGTSAHAAR